jgi:hypothetical protein
MHKDHDAAQDRTEAQDSREDYVAPALSDLGSFAELTQFGTGGNADLEGAS